MGCWGVGVMEGDTAMDIGVQIEIALEELVGIPESDIDRLDSLVEEYGTEDPRYIVAQQAFLKQIRDWVAVPHNQASLIKQVIKFSEEDTKMVHLIVGACFMEQGFPLIPDVVIAVRQAAKCDEWAKTDVERREAMQQFITILDAYDHVTPTDVPSKGLMETLSVLMKAKKAGM